MSTRKRSPEDFDREIRAHLEIETSRLIEEGLTPEAARTESRRRFGSVARAHERRYEAGRALWLDHTLHDLRCAFRNLRRYPLAAMVGIASLAAGIGATTVTLMVRDAVFRKPPPLYQRPEQISRVQVGRSGALIMPIGSYVPGGLYTIWKDTLGDAIAAAAPTGGVRDVRSDHRTDTVAIKAVTPELFALLGVSPELGHDFTGAAPSGPAPAVLSYRLWQQLFEGRSDVLGRIVWIDNEPRTIVGVMPKRFWYSETNSPIWIALDRQNIASDQPLEVVVRRPDGVTTSMLEARLQSGMAEFAGHLPANQRQLRLKVSGIEGTPLGNQVALVLPYVLGTSVLLTLLIACANVAILMIAQWTAREHEIAIRASIGASRGRIVRALVTESVLIAAFAGALGVCATYALRGWVLHGGGADLSFFDVGIDFGILAKTAAIALLAGLAAGLAPALSETRRLHGNPLRTMATSDRVRQRWRHALVVLEITVTVALLVETAAMIDGYLRARTADMGYSTRPLMTVRVESPSGVPTERVLDVLRGLPGVAAAAASTTVPNAASGPRERVAADAAGTNEVIAERGAITGNFFTALGVAMRAGRAFSDQDSSVTRTAIVNEALARRVFSGRDPVGGRVWIAGVPFDVVGVVADYVNNPLQKRALEPRVFLPLPPESKDVTRMQFLVRADGEPSPLVQTIRREVRDRVKGVTVTRSFTMDQILAVMGQEVLLGTAPLFPLIATGMLLTTAGIYGVLAFAITRRSRELAVRVAMGARGTDLVRLVTGHAMRLVALGSMLGVGFTFTLSRLVRAGGGGGSIFDPPVQAFVIPVLIILVIGALATWIPSRRALKIDPAVLLKAS